MRSRHLICSAALLSRLAFTAQAQEAVPEAFVVRHARLELAVDFPATRLSGAMTLEMENWTPKPANSVSFVLNRLMDASQVRDGAGAALQYTQDVLRFRDSPKRQVTQIIVKLPKPIPPGARTTVRIDYAGYIAPYTEVGWLYVRDHIDTAFTIIRADAMAFPMVGGLSAAANGRAPFPDFTYDVSVRVPSKYIVATGGVASRTPHDDGTVTWHYVSTGASPFMDIAIAPFDTLVQRDVHVFYFPSDSVGARRLMARAQATLDTLTGWFGPLHSALNLTITEIPDGWGSSAHLVGGIIQTAAAFQDPTRLNELYHELTHLWNPPDIDNPSPRWNEGLASFLEDLLLERMDGWGKRAKSDSSRIAAMKKAIAGDSTLRRVPFIDYGKQRMTDRAYSVGRLMFSTLHDLIGEEQFNQVIRVYSQQFAKGGTTQDLIRTANTTTGRDLSSFFNDWMFTTNWTTRVLAASSITDLVAHYRASPGPAGAVDINIPFERITLANGLNVILSPDHTIPQVTVDVWYHVGSKNEVPGRTGFAHMFEHVMFTGSAHAPYGLLDRLTESVGGNNNGSTTNDRTHYYENIPSNYLESTLWLEADRMGFLLDKLDEAKFVAQRDIVQNERRQGIDNQPYGRIIEVIEAALMPESNPYSWPVVGYMSDLQKATVEDVRQFFRIYYAPSNATLAVVGDFDPAQTKAWVTKYFGDLKRGGPITRPKVIPPVLVTERRLVFEDRVQVARLSLAWPTVGDDNDDSFALQALTQVLSGPRTARLTKTLVYDLQSAANIGASDNSAENAGYLTISITPRPGHSLAELEGETDSVIERLKRDGPTASEMAKTAAGLEFGFVSRLQSNYGKAQVLNDGFVFHGDAAHYKTVFAKLKAVTGADVKRVANKYLGPGRVVLSTVPLGKADQASKLEKSTKVTVSPDGGHYLMGREP